MTTSTSDFKITIYCKFYDGNRGVDWNLMVSGSEWWETHEKRVREIASIVKGEESGLLTSAELVDPASEAREFGRDSPMDDGVPSGWDEEPRLPDDSSALGRPPGTCHEPDEVSIDPRVDSEMSIYKYNNFRSLASDRNIVIEPFFFKVPESDEIHTPLRYMTIQKTRPKSTQTQSDASLEAIFPFYNGGNIITVLDALKKLAEGVPLSDIYPDLDQSTPQKEKSWHHYISHFWTRIANKNHNVSDCWEPVAMEFSLDPGKKRTSEACDLLLAHEKNSHRESIQQTNMAETEDKYMIVEVKKPGGDIKRAIGQALVYREMLNTHFCVSRNNIYPAVGTVESENPYDHLSGSLDDIKFIDIKPLQHSSW